MKEDFYEKKVEYEKQYDSIKKKIIVKEWENVLALKELKILIVMF